MVMPRVKLRLIKRKKRLQYPVDCASNGRRPRTIVGPKSKDAEYIQAKIQSDLPFGERGIPITAEESVCLSRLIKIFLDNKKMRAKQSSHTRCCNTYARPQNHSIDLFPTAASDIQSVQRD